MPLLRRTRAKLKRYDNAHVKILKALEAVLLLEEEHEVVMDLMNADNRLTKAREQYRIGLEDEIERR